MIGSEKQIKWATEIKNKILVNFQYILDSEDVEDLNIKKYYKEIMDIKDSKFWIEYARNIRNDLDFKWFHKRATDLGFLNV
jgi:hypothetical protein